MKYDKDSYVVIPNKKILKGEASTVQSVYFWICDHADSSGQCWPSIKTLAIEAGCSERTVDAAIKRLVELGILTKSNRFKDNEQQTNIYQINLVSAPPSATIAPPLAQPLRTELNPILIQSNISEAQLRVVRVTTEDKEVTPRQKTDLTYRKVFELWPKYPLNWRSNRTEIAAAKNILAEHSLEEARNALNYAKQNEHEEKCPQMLKPSDLDRKWVNLQAFRDKR